MADYMLIYKGGDPSWRERPVDQIQAAMQAWGQWFQRLESTGNLRNPGAPLDWSGLNVRKTGRGIQTEMASAELKELIGGYSIVSADSLEQAAELAKDCPFLENNPTGIVLVQPVVQMG